jgi:plastocyanin
MKNTHIIIIILVVLLAAILLFFGMSKKAEAPVSEAPATSLPNAQPVGNTAAVKEFVVSGQNFSFTPSVITVKKGDNVKITFKNVNGFHNLKIDEFNVSTKTIRSGAEDSIQFVADKSGSFQYYCSVSTHRAMGMWGTLKVE